MFDASIQIAKPEVIVFVIKLINLIIGGIYSAESAIIKKFVEAINITRHINRKDSFLVNNPEIIAKINSIK